MFTKILATTVLVTLLASPVLAQESPGQSLPVEPEASSEEMLILNSAPSESPSLELSEITVVPEVSEAVLSFSTSEETHIFIEYGLTPDYERTISTEPQTEHLETLGELLPCATYYYRVSIEDASREGAFQTLCPVIAQSTKHKAQSREAAVMNNEQGIMNNEEEIVLNAAPEVAQNDEGIMNNENGAIDEETPETPAFPGPIAFGNDTLTEKEDTTNSLPVGLLLFALLSGMIVILFSFKQKKWYQK